MEFCCFLRSVTFVGRFLDFLGAMFACGDSGVTDREIECWGPDIVVFKKIPRDASVS